MTTAAADVMTDVRTRVDELDWSALDAQLDEVGHASTPVLLTEDKCGELSDLFDGGRFRSTIDMARHRFGDGRYRYFDHPLPELIAALRAAFYPSSGGGRKPLERAAARGYPRFPVRPPRAARALPPGRTDPTHPADPALRPRRLERAAPGSVRRRVLPLPDPDGPVAARRRLRRRRVRAARAAAAGPEPGSRPDPGAGNVRHLPHPRAPRPRAQRLSPRGDAPRRVHRDRWTPHRPGGDLP